MRLSLTNLILLFLLPINVLSTRLHITIPISATLPNPATLLPSTTASLVTLSQMYTTPLNVHNSFDFRNISAGSYLLDIHCATHTFAPLRIDVHKDGAVEAWMTFRGHEWENKGEVISVNEVEDGKGLGLGVRVLGGKEYFMERSGFSPLNLLKNPMILIAGASMAIVFGMPYLMDSMDPEMRAEFEERQKASPVSGLLAGQQAGANPLQNFDAAAWLAGSGTKKSDSSVPIDRGVSR